MSRNQFELQDTKKVTMPMTESSDMRIATAIFEVRKRTGIELSRAFVVDHLVQTMDEKQIVKDLAARVRP